MTDTPLWVFGYGSLIWNPGFEPAETAIATLPGYARSFCMRSIHHRGTEEEPGLVLALDAHAGAECHGVAFRMPEDKHDEIMAYLRERELISSAYLEENHTITFRDGRALEAVTYVIDANHVQYCGGLALETQAQIIAKAVGGRGPNTEYLFNTASHVAELGLHDEDLEWLVQRVTQLTDTVS